MDAVLGEKIQVIYRSYSSFSDMAEDLHKGELDVIFPVFSDMWVAEQYGLAGTADVISIGSDFVYAGEYAKEKERKIAVVQGNYMQLADLRDRHILLAEDNDLNAEIAIAILTEMGCQVDRACDGLECVDMLTKAASDYYDLVLMDVQMPNMNGLQATGAIRSMLDQSKAKIPIVAMTANAFEEDRKRCLEAGMNDHLGKPIDVAIMLQVIARYVK